MRGLRLVSQLDLDPDPDTLEQMRDEAASIELVSGERLGDELVKLLEGQKPAKALLIARDTGVLAALVPEFEPTIGLEQESARQHLPLDEHIFAVVQAAVDAGATLPVRLGALLHDLGKPEDDDEHAERGAEIASGVLRRLRYPTRLRAYVTRLIRAHSFPLEDVDELYARRFLREHGDDLAFDLVAHKEADLRGKRAPAEELEAAARLRRLLEAERGKPHRLTDLAVDGSDLIGVGFSEGPELGQTLEALLDDVIEDPSLNTRDELLERAEARRG